MEQTANPAQKLVLQEHRFLQMYKASKPKQESPTLQDKNLALKYICNATTSLPTITIATRDRIEAEMIARRRAEFNRLAMDMSLEGVNADVSPGALDMTH